MCLRPYVFSWQKRECTIKIICLLDYRQPFGHKVLVYGEERDVMSLVGASPDGVLVDSETGEIRAVFEAKTKSPFALEQQGTPGACA